MVGERDLGEFELVLPTFLSVRKVAKEACTEK
jgi:hypothetical protein